MLDFGFWFLDFGRGILRGAESLMALMGTDNTDPFLPSTPVGEVVGGSVQSVV